MKLSLSITKKNIKRFPFRHFVPFFFFLLSNFLFQHRSGYRKVSKKKEKEKKKTLVLTCCNRHSYMYSWLL